MRQMQKHLVAQNLAKLEETEEKVESQQNWNSWKEASQAEKLEQTPGGGETEIAGQVEQR